MKKGEIWIVDIPQLKNGREQHGLRPAIMLAETEANIAIIIIPFTSHIQSLKFPHTSEIKPSGENGLKEISVALVFQIRAIDKKRLKHKIGFLGEQKCKEIDEMLKRLLKI